MRRYDQAILKHFGNDAYRDDVELKQKLQEFGDDRIERLQQGKVQENDVEAIVFSRAERDDPAQAAADYAAEREGRLEG